MPRKLTDAPEELFWYFISERHAVYINRMHEFPKPWTKDPILQTYKFTNVFRQLDRGTVWLTDNFIKPHENDPHDLILANVAWYRMFNWTGTGELLGWRTSWPKAALTKKLVRAQKRGDQVFTGAHIVWGEPGLSKIDGVMKACTAVWQRRNLLARLARFHRSLEVTFEHLREIRGLGGFTAYEIVSDLRWTPLLQDARDVNTWANVGPGALRGLRRLNPEMRTRDGLNAMIDLLWRGTDPKVRGAHVPRLELRDIEHSLCEFDKFCRVKFGEGRPRSKYPGKGDEK